MRLVLLLALAGCEAPPPAPLLGAPTVVHVIGCTLRADRTTPYRDDLDTTPNLGRLAREGVVFERTLANAPWTRPSVAALTTGRYPLSLAIDDERPRGQTDRGVHPDVETLAERFKAAGWTTLGATTNPNANAHFGLAQGFDTYWEATGLWRDDLRKVGGRHAVDALSELLPAVEGPLYLQVLLVDAHAPYRARRKDLLRLGPAYWFTGSSLAQYDANLGRLDAAIAELDALLATLGRGDRLLSVVGDHGEGLNTPAKAMAAHGRRLYDANVHVPWLVHGPGVAGGRRVSGLSESVDVPSTLLELAGLPLTDDLQGESRAAMVRGEADATGEREAFSETFFGADHGWRYSTPEWALVFDARRKDANGQRRGTFELYPADGVDLDGEVSRENPMVVSRLRERVDALRSELEAGQQLWEAAPSDEDTKAQLRALGYQD